MEIKLFDPRLPTQDKPVVTTAPRPQRLEGLRVALIDNSKHNSKSILLRIYERLQQRHQLELAGLYTKRSPGHPVDEQVVGECRNNADIAIAGIGD